MTILRQSEGTWAEIRPTPWDQRTFGYPTSEIQRIHHDSIENLRALLVLIEDWNTAHCVQYCVARIDATDADLKAILQTSDYYFAEASITLSKSKLDSCDFDKITRRRLSLRSAEARDRLAVQKIASEDFKFGRFLEDPFLEAGLGAKRHANWVSDLLDQGLLQVATTDTGIIGFHAERIAPCATEADLILTGMAGRYAMLSLPLWTSALVSLQQRGVSRVSTMISAANIGVINLYRALDFHFDTTVLGFHKRYQ